MNAVFGKTALVLIDRESSSVTPNHINGVQPLFLRKVFQKSQKSCLEIYVEIPLFTIYFQQ